MFAFLLLALFLMIAILSHAQEDPAPPKRNTDRMASERKPEIVSQTEQPDGVNTVIVILSSANAYIASGRPNDNLGMTLCF